MIAHKTLYLDKTRKGPGLLAKSHNNIQLQRVFDELVDGLYRFYETKDMIMVPKKFDPCESEYIFPVYDQENYPEMYIQYLRNSSDEIIDQKVMMGDVPYSTWIKMQTLKPESGEEYVKEWDFPHSPFRWTKQKLWIYFNAVNPNKIPDKARSFEERNAFLEYTEDMML